MSGDRQARIVTILDRATVPGRQKEVTLGDKEECADTSMVPLGASWCFRDHMDSRLTSEATLA